MGKNTSISLSDHHLEFLHQQVESGRYGSTSEVIRDALRLHEEREAKLSALRSAVQDGIDSGPSRPFDMRAWLEKKHPTE